MSLRGVAAAAGVIAVGLLLAFQAGLFTSAQEGGAGNAGKGGKAARGGKAGKKPSRKAAARRFEPEQPDVLFILWDTVRADRMSVYGHRGDTTPRLEAFAADATVFENATSTDTWTLPSHAAMFTGLYGTTHGASAEYRWLDHRFVTLPELLGAAGYDTIAFSSNVVVSGRTNLLQGFQKVRHSSRSGDGIQKKAKKALKEKRIPRDASTEISPAFRTQQVDLHWERAAFKDAAPIMVDEFLEWVDKREADRPYFAYMNFMEAHTPRMPSMWARNQVVEPELLELGLKTPLSQLDELEYIGGVRDYDRKEIRAVRGVYDATLAELDAATGDLIDALERRGRLDDTVIVIVSDHGESLGEHGLFEHRYGVWQTLLHVPLIVRYPRALEPGRVRRRVSTIDLFETLLDLGGANGPGYDIHSRSFLDRSEARSAHAQLLDPNAPSLGPLLRLHSDIDPSRWLHTYAVQFDRDLKLIRNNEGVVRLYNVARDPEERKNLWDARAEAGQQMLAELEAWEASLAPYDPSGRTERDKVPEMDEETMKMLELLGYAEGVDQGH